jgi:hypothetical protein
MKDKWNPIRMIINYEDFEDGIYSLLRSSIEYKSSQYWRDALFSIAAEADQATNDVLIPMARIIPNAI